MLKNQIACCYFPTNAVFVDDRQDYLTSLKMMLDKNLACQFYTDPNKAINFLKQEYKPNPFIKKWLFNLKENKVELNEELDKLDLTHTFFDIDIASIHKEIYSPDRFNEISVIVVDYAMPKMSGIEFSTQLRTELANTPIKILMLTGQASHELGVEALNDGIIDRFIIKSTNENFQNKLNHAIADLQLRYFIEISKPIMQNIASNKHSCLNDPDFINFFHELLQQNKITEYYLVNDSGCFLLLDISGNISWLAVKSEEDMENFYDCVIANEGPKNIAKSLKNREKLLFLLNAQSQNFDSFEEWQEYLHPATKFQGKNNIYYYSFIQGESVYDVKARDIADYVNYLKNK